MKENCLDAIRDALFRRHNAIDFTKPLKLQLHMFELVQQLPDELLQKFDYFWVHEQSGGKPDRPRRYMGIAARLPVASVLAAW